MALKKSIKPPEEPGFDALRRLIKKGGPSLRIHLARLLEDAKREPGCLATRVAELLFQRHLIGPANRCREQYAQIRKHDDYETTSAVAATEQFCRQLYAALLAQGIDSNVKADLGANDKRVIDQVWHLRQLADVARRRHEDWISEFVALLFDLVRGREQVKAAELVRHAEVLFEKLTL